MALKFLNKKGWHTGSLRNIENVWKAEQKNDAEKKKLEELKKQIQEEREKSEFRDLQVQAGLIPRQERLDFLYESGLAVGKGSSDGFKALESPAAEAGPSAAVAAAAAAEGSASKAATPGALFEEKPQSANDAWRKLHSDPLLLIRQREQEALARIKNNPIRMAMIRKSVEAEKKNKQDDKVKKKKKQHKRKHKLSKSNEKDSVSETSSESEEATQRGHHLTSERQAKGKRSKYPSNVVEEEEGRRKDDNLKSNHKRSYSEHEKHSSRIHSDSRYSSESEEDMRKGGRSISERHSKYPSNNVKEEERRKGDCLISDHRSSYSKHVKHSSGSRSHSKYLGESEEDRRKGGSYISERHHKYSHSTNSSKHPENEEEKRKHVSSTSDRYNPSSEPGSGNKNWETHPQNRQGPGYNRRRGVPKMTEEEREARLREMQLDAELHEEQRWKRVKKAAEADAQESARASSSGGKNFLDAAQKSIYGTEKGGSSTIEESVRRRAYFSQGGTAANESNAFRR